MAAVAQLRSQYDGGSRKQFTHQYAVLGANAGFVSHSGTLVFADGFSVSGEGTALLSRAIGGGIATFGGFTVQASGDTWRRLIYTPPPPIVIPPYVGSSSDKVCGIDGSPARLPNDPDFDNTTLSAVAGLYGVTVFWTYPLVNPWAVAYWTVYRSIDANFSNAIEITKAEGSSYFDPFENAEVGDTWYYWVRPVSINGLLGDLVGPAMAVFQPPIDTIIDLLEDRLSESALNQALKEKIRRITDLESALSDEEQARLLGDSIFSQLLAELRTDLQDIDTIVANEVVERINGDDALVAQLQLLFARSNDNAAAIQTESAVRANETSALALNIQTLQATVGQNSASVQTVQQAVANIDGGLSAHWMVKTDVNGYVAGFGLWNDGNVSEFIIRADRFAIGNAGNDDVFPFIIDRVNGQQVIALNAKALIPDASIGVAQIERIIQSSNYSPNQAGWRIDSVTGSAQFNNVRARGDIEATSIKAGTANIVNTLMLQNEAVLVPRNSSGRLSARTFSSGDVTLASVPVSVGNTGQAVRIIVIAHSSIYPTSGSGSATFRQRIKVNGVLNTEAGQTVEAGGENMCSTGSFLVPSGWSGTVTVTLNASSSKSASAIGGIIVMAAKR